MKNAKIFRMGLSSFEAEGAAREPREAFIRRGLAARDNAKATGEYVSKEAVMDSLRRKLRSAKG